MDLRFIDDIARKVGEALPSGARELRNDIEKNLKALLQSSFEKMDLVTRAEFDVQAQVLARTRAKIEVLERQVAELEQRLQERP